MRIQLAKLAKRFGKVQALREIDLDLPPGAKVALIGPNGSGKTTLIRALLGLVGHGGQVHVDGAPLDRAMLAPRLGYVPQIAPQLAATCGELVRTVADLRGLAVTEIAELTEQLDLHLATVAARPFRTLSGGSKQKLLIALAMAARPDLLILDEPTASLDADARSRFFQLHRDRASGATLILCSHRLEEIRTLVDHVVALEDGRLSYDGPAGDYLARRVGTLVELQVASDPTGWLSANGFTAGGNGWWRRGVDRAAKVELVPAAARALGPDLLDLVVRDVDLVELQREVGHA